jgi:hypothetical protein
VPPPAASLATLRQLLGERFPEAHRAPESAGPIGVDGIDRLAGGLPRHAVTEFVCAAPSCGAQLLLGQVLHRVRADRGRAALIDCADDFDPGSWPADDLRCLVWLRCRTVQDALPLADLFARDANLQLVFLDLRHAAARDLRRIPATSWYRLQRALQQTDASLLVFTPTAVVPSAQLRITLERSFDFPALSAPRPTLTAALPISVQRQRLAPHSAAG